MRKLLLILAFAFPLLALSQQDPISLFQQFNGRYDFTAIGNTLNENENNNGYCGMLSESSATLNLEPNQTLVSAHLYWSSIGTGDFQVDINGNDTTADSTFSHTSNGSTYFSAYADVADLSATTWNAEYSFAGLDVPTLLSEYCSWPNGNGTGTNVGGRAIHIIYEDPALLLNQISLFDGLESVNVFANPINLTLKIGRASCRERV